MLKGGLFIQNRYEIISHIGSGGMADVYKAKDHKLNRYVAVKVLKKEFRDDKTFISKFRVEAQSAAGLAHANIVNIYDVGEEAGIYYIVMELVEGITLKEYIGKKGRLSVREATSIALQISAGLEAAHNNGVIHRDVKPQNIIISIDGKVKVTDFGIARASTSNTINSNVMGSVHYSSPEQARGGYSDEKSDIYSLGITMYEMLTGHVPYDGDTAVAVAIKHLQEEFHGPKELVPEIPYSTNQIVLKCTQKSPDRRYSNMAELIRDLRESLVNPDGDFVSIPSVDHTSRTIVISKDDVEKINGTYRQGGGASSMPSYDENMDVGAAAGLHDKEEAKDDNRAYQSGSYYRNSGYQEVSPKKDGRDVRRRSQVRQDDPDDVDDLDGYYDVYDDRDSYGFHEDSYELEKSYASEHDDSDSDIAVNSRLEKIVTVGGIIAAVVIGCIFLSLLGNAFGLFNFSRKNRNEKGTESVTEQAMTQAQSQTTASEAATEKATEKVTEAAAPTGNEAQEVPDVTGLTEAEALLAISQKGFVAVKMSDVYSSTVAAGQVCSQTPRAGQKAAPGTEVSYSLSLGVEGLTLQDLAGYTQADAQSYLVEQGLQYLVENEFSDTVEQGQVIRTDPSAASSIEAGDVVTLYVSQGSEANAVYVTVPDFWYTDQDTSRARAQMSGLGDPIYEYEPSAEVQQDWVCRQSIEKGTQVLAGTAITLYLSSGPNGESTASAQQEQTPQGTWVCNASLEAPAGYTGQQVQIDLVQGGSTTTVFEGNTEFPYYLQVEGIPGETTGTAYVYLLNENGEIVSSIEYAGIVFSAVTE